MIRRAKESATAVSPSLVWAAVILITVDVSLTLAQPRGTTPACRPVGSVARVSDLPEGSGIAASRRNPGHLWSHNDSGAQELIALNDAGAVVGRIRLSGVKVDDWEAVAVGPCPGGSCVYVGDIGDNSANRKRISVYRLQEPDPATGSAKVQEVFHATYPDGPHDAETLLVTPKGDIFVVTKGDTGPVALYRFPREMKPGSTVALEPVGPPRDGGKPSGDARITDGAVSPNGAWIALRTNRVVYLHPASDLIAGNWREATRVDLTDLGEPQGEGITFADDKTLYLTGEGGGKSQPGTFARLTCSF